MGVKWIKAMLTVAFIGAFALATNHCRLEVLKGLEFLVCCSHDAETQSTAPHQDDDCETDGCASLEEGLYKSEDGRVVSGVPPVFAIMADLVPHDESRATALSVAGSFPPPELPRT